MTRGRYGSLLLHRDGLAPSTPCRSPGALRCCPNRRQKPVWSVCPRRSSRPEEFHLQALPEPCVNLSIHTAPDVRPLAHAASGFASSTSSSCRQLASVGRWSRLNNAAPSVQLHYRAFVPNTSCSAPVLRIGTLVLTVLAACDFFLCIGATGSHVPYQSPVELRAASMPDAAWAVSGIPQADPGGMATPRF